MAHWFGRTCKRCGDSYLGFGPTCSKSKCSRPASPPKQEQEEKHKSSTIIRLSEFLDEDPLGANFRAYWNLIMEFWLVHCREVKAKALWKIQNTSGFEDSGSTVEKVDTRREALWHQLRPEIERCFKEHDLNQDGVLDGEEIHNFLADYANWQLEVCEYIVRCGAELCLMRRSPVDPIDTKELNELSSAMTAALREQQTLYKESAREHHMNVAKILDPQGDGTLNMEMVVQGMLPGTTKNHRFARRLPTFLAGGLLPEWRPVAEKSGEESLSNAASTMTPAVSAVSA